MCGIAGFFGAGDGALLRRMTDRIAHRGPDAEGFFEKPDAGVFLGHRRLSIIDLAGGAQPMFTADGQTAIVFNGEIYNHCELRSELQAKGHVFATDHSDTEVLLYAWREWGPAMLERLNGMWAFAILDAPTRSLFLARDCFGKKPLYWFHRQGTFGFASELTALLEHPQAPRNESEIARVKFLAHALIPAPHTAIDGIFKLTAGHHLTIKIDGSTPVIQRWWRFKLEPDASPKSESVLVDELLEILTRATNRRLIADVPLAATDILLMPSRFEGLPMTLLEAMAMGLPVVASKLDGIAEVIEGGREGFLIDSNDTQGFVERCAALFENPAKSSELATNARAKIEAHFSVERMTSAVEAIYDQFLP